MDKTIAIILINPVYNNDKNRKHINVLSSKFPIKCRILYCDNYFYECYDSDSDDYSASYCSRDYVLEVDQKGDPSA